jgi:hypothetical protein
MEVYGAHTAFRARLHDRRVGYVFAMARHAHPVVLHRLIRTAGAKVGSE